MGGNSNTQALAAPAPDSAVTWYGAIPGRPLTDCPDPCPAPCINFDRRGTTYLHEDMPYVTTQLAGIRLLIGVGDGRLVGVHIPAYGALRK